ncbi:MAG: hypothetical protein WKG00_23695 [Polyangiaceae bacterium]
MHGTAVELEVVARSHADAPACQDAGSIVVDAHGARALVWPEGGLLEHIPQCFDLRTAAFVDREVLRLCPDGKHGICKIDDRLTTVDLDSGETVADIDGPRWPSNAPQPADWPFATQVRVDCPLDARPSPSCVINDLARGSSRQVNVRSYLSAATPGGRMLLVDDERRVRLFDLAGGEELARSEKMTQAPRQLRLLGGGSHALVVGARGDAWIWALEPLRLEAKRTALCEIRGPLDAGVRVLDDGWTLLSPTETPTLFDAKADTLRSWDAKGPKDRIWGAQPLPGTGLLATLMGRGLMGPRMLEIWDVAAGVLLGAQEVSSERVHALGCGPGGRIVYVQASHWDDEPGAWVPTLTVLALRPAPGQPLPTQPESMANASTAAVRVKPAPKKAAPKKAAPKKAAPKKAAPKKAAPKKAAPKKPASKTSAASKKPHPKKGTTHRGSRGR